MSKKKAIKIVAASAIAASSFAAVAPTQADAASSISKTVSAAKAAMKKPYTTYATSTKYVQTSTVKKQVEAAEKAYSNAVKAVDKAKLSSSKKKAYKKDLAANKKYISYANRYIEGALASHNDAKGFKLDLANISKAIEAGNFDLAKTLISTLERDVLAADKAVVLKVVGKKAEKAIKDRNTAPVTAELAKLKEAVQTQAVVVKAINATTVEVTFDAAVTNVNSLVFTIDGLTVSNAAVKQTDNKTVVLTTSAQEGKQYAVKLDGKEIGKFTGVSAVIPTSISVVERSQQGILGQQVTLQAQVTVAEGQSKAGIPVTFNITSGLELNAPQVVEATTNAEGIATYTYTRYASTTDSVVAYATGDRTKFSSANVYWSTAKLLTVEEVTTGNTLANGAKKVYKVTGAANTTYNIAYKENLNTTADKLVTVQVVDINGVGTTLYPYQLSNNAGSRQVTIVTNDSGVATFTLTGSNESVTPIVFRDTAVDNDKFDANELFAQAPTLKFEDVAYRNLAITAVGSNYAARDYGVKGQGGRDYTVTLKDNNGNVAKKGEKVYVFLDSTKSSGAYLLDRNGNKVAPSNGTTGVIEAVVSNDKGEATFTVYGEGFTSYATPVVFVDRNNNQTLQSTDLKVTGDMTYFADATSSSVSVKFFDAANNEVTSEQSAKTVRAELSVLDQNGKLNPVSSTARFEVTNESATNLTVTGATSETFSQTTKTFVVNVVNGKASISLNAAGPLTAKVYASSGVLSNTQSVTFTANSNATVATGTVSNVDPVAKTLTVTDALNNAHNYTYSDSIYQLAGQTIDLAKFESKLVGAVVTVTKNSDGKFIFNQIDVTGGSAVAAAPSQPTLTTTRIVGGGNVTIVDFAAGFTAWLAPAGTTVFTEGATMTKLVGTAGADTTIVAPTTAGEYKLFLVDAYGRVSTASTATLTVDNTAIAGAVVTGSYKGGNANLIEAGENLVFTFDDEVVTGDVANLLSDFTTAVFTGETAGGAADGFTVAHSVVGGKSVVTVTAQANKAPEVISTFNTTGTITITAANLTDVAGNTPAGNITVDFK